MTSETKQPRCGLNGNMHRQYAYDPEGVLAKWGIVYLGGGDWRLPDGASITHCGEDNWTLTMANGDDWNVWSDD